MFPALTVNDSVDATLVVCALEQFGHDYIDTAVDIMLDPRTSDYAQLVIRSNMQNVTERIVRMTNAITDSMVTPVPSDNKEN